MEINLVKDLSVVMAAAGATTLLCHRFKQPVVIGYLLAGLLIGPFTPPFAFVSNLQSIHTMAELGLVFLLFSLGLEFNLPKIHKVGLSAGLAAIFEVIGMAAIGYYVGQAFGWSRLDSIFLGAIVSISSTTIIAKVFMDMKMMNEKFAQIVFGILVFEDIVAVAYLSLLSGLATHQASNAGTVFYSLLRTGTFIVVFLVAGLLTVPSLTQWVARFKSKEMLGIVTLALCLGGAVMASQYQLSMALGAFLTGAVLAASKQINEIEEWIHPVRDFFSAIFFVSAGMLIQPELLWIHKWPIAIIALITILGKSISGTLGSFIAGYDIKTSARVGISLTQIGEFSFVIASLGLSLNVTSDFLYPIAIAVSFLNALIRPPLIHHSDTLVDGILSHLPARLRAWIEREKIPEHSEHGTAIFSKHLVRLIVYVALFAAFLAFLNTVSRLFSADSRWAIGLWLLSGVLFLPLFTNISKYANHILLLLATRSKRFLHLIDIHSFYNTLHLAAMVSLTMIFVYAASTYLIDYKVVFGMGLLLLLLTRFFRKRISLGREWLERILDQITGLATSEPTRQAILKSGESALLLVDITDQITLQDHSSAVNKTIRDIQLRKITGATIVAIYRNGVHLANPDPDEKLFADDILILLGNKNELESAKTLLQKAQS